MKTSTWLYHLGQHTHDEKVPCNEDDSHFEKCLLEAFGKGIAPSGHIFTVRCCIFDMTFQGVHRIAYMQILLTRAISSSSLGLLPHYLEVVHRCSFAATRWLELQTNTNPFVAATVELFLWLFVNLHDGRRELASMHCFSLLSFYTLLSNFDSSQRCACGRFDLR